MIMAADFGVDTGAQGFRLPQLSLGSEGRVVMRIVWTVIVAIVIGMIINLFFDGSSEHRRLWFEATIAVSCLTIFVAVCGYIAERLRAVHRRRYLAELDEIAKQGTSEFRKY
jgi:hypothetical protein